MAITSRERLNKVMNQEIPDHVPAAPDISNMIPAKLTGKPFWEIYLYQNPPQWKAYIVSKKAIDDAGEDGGFVLSTGDQCGRDTPEENIFAMIETAKNYGKY